MITHNSPKPAHPLAELEDVRPRFVTVEQYARYMQMPASTVYQHCAQGHIPCTVVGRRAGSNRGGVVRIPISALPQGEAC